MSQGKASNTLLIIEDEPMLGDLLREFFGMSESLELLGTIPDGQKGWEEVQALKPDFVLLDIRLPSLNGIEILRNIKKRLPSIKVLMFSGSLVPSHIKQALELGTDGIIEKAAGLVEMKNAIETILGGRPYFSPTVMTAMREIMLNPEKTEGIAALSNREREVLQLVAEGYSTKEIGSKLGLETKTVETHRANVSKKLGVKGVAGLTRFAVDEGIV